MKHIRLPAAVLLLLLALSLAACAGAAEIRPVETDRLDIDLNNGTFCLTVKDADRIASGGWFTASLYLEDRYETAQIQALAPGDTVLVNGKAWTVQEVVHHEEDSSGLGASLEIYTEEENDGYIVFSPSGGGYCICITDDWSPVSPLADVRVMLPLPDRFEYVYGEDGSGDMDLLIDHLEQYGGSFVAYNTSCVFEDGQLIRITHSDYPMGPAGETADTDMEADDADASLIPVWKFCHGLRDGLETAVIKGYTNDCEAGPAEYEMTPEEMEEIRNIAINGVITGKANDMSVTGGTWSYTFETPEGQSLLSIEMYKGWIVDAATGMYEYEK